MLAQISQKNYFQLFDQLEDYKVDFNSLQNKLRELQKQYHPDNFVSQDQEQLTQAIAVSSLINQAYNTLTQPLERAIYLLKLRGIEVDLVHDTKFSQSFLIEQIELREQIGEAEENQDFDALEAIEQSLQADSNQLELQIEQSFKTNDFTAIREQIKHLAFYSKLEQLVNNTLAQI